MNSIKIYNNINKTDNNKSFGISRMEEIYAKRQKKTDSPHRHDYYTVLLARKARGRHVIDFNSYMLSDRQVYFINPGQVHQLIEDEAPIGFSIVFSSNFLMENNIASCFIEDLNLFHDYGFCPPMKLTKGQFLKLSDYCEQIFRLYHSDDKFKKQAMAALLELFLISCNSICTKPYGNTQKREAGNAILKDFKKLVDQNYTDWHGLFQYAQKLNITPDHLNRTIKSLIGKTAKEYIQSRITISAKRLLYFSNYSVKEISYKLGFSEPANFSAFFKKCTGLSPTRFRHG